LAVGAIARPEKIRENETDDTAAIAANNITFYCNLGGVPKFVS
jgi:hypothetical protein